MMKSQTESELAELRAEYRGRLTVRQRFGFVLTAIGFWILRVARWFVVGASVAGCGSVFVELYPDADVGDQVAEADAGDQVADEVLDELDGDQVADEVLDELDGDQVAEADAGDELAEADAGDELAEADAAPCGVWFWPDVDRDGHGAGAPSWIDCDRPPPDGYVASSDDCCDTDPRVHPGADWQDTPHACAGIDRWDFDCDGSAILRWGCPSCGTAPTCELVAEGFDAGGCASVPCGTGAELASACEWNGAAACVPTGLRAARQECR